MGSVARDGISVSHFIDVVYSGRSSLHSVSTQWANQSAQMMISKWIRVLRGWSGDAQWADHADYVMIRDQIGVLRDVLSFTQWSKSGKRWALIRKGKGLEFQALSGTYVPS